MLDGERTYYNKLHSIDDTIIHLKEATKLLNLEFETFSYESGIGFVEHYHYNRGISIIEEFISFEDLDITITRNDVDEYTGEKLNRDEPITDLQDYWLLFRDRVVDKYFN